MTEAHVTAQALRLLAQEIKAPDDVPAMCLRDAADLIGQQAADLAQLKQENHQLREIACKATLILNYRDLDWQAPREERHRREQALRVAIEAMHTAPGPLANTG